jgi:5-(carboxyamino)imidazole ribonucleotide synthase
VTLTTPGPTLGVVGGGQLGRMLGEAAGPLGVEVVVVDPTPDCPAAPVVADQIIGGFDDREALAELAERADFLTFEIELADPDVMEAVAAEADVPVHPDPDTLRTIQDKLVQNEALADAGIPIPEFRQVDSPADLRAACEDLGYPAMLKAREGGYDGRGTALVESPADVEAAFESIGGAALVEEFLDYDRELAVMGCVGDGAVDTFPVTETIHRDAILRETVSPARTDDATLSRAREVATDVLELMDGRGVFGIELFEVGGEILVNEIAPRPHNSGHWTIEGCLTSQFAQHIRAVTGRPLGATDRRSPTALANLLGDVDEAETPGTLRGVDEALSVDGLGLHWYGKREVRPLRKMGHVTQVGAQGAAPDDVLERVRGVRDGLTFR